MKRKRVLALFLVLSIVFSSNGITALAAGTDFNEADVTVEEPAVESGIEAEEEEPDAYDEDAGTSADISEETGEEETGTEAPDADDDTQTDVSQEADVLEPRMLSFTDEAGMTVTYDANVEYEYTIEEGVLTGIKIKTDTEEPGDPVSGVVVIEEGKGITAIGETAFSGNTGITYVKLPTGVTTIDQNAFKGCTALEGITIPAGVTTIGESAFENCGKLIQLAVPKTLETIGDRAFYNDISLFMVYMKDATYGQLKTIGASAFYNCKALEEFCSDTEFVFPETTAEIGESAFEGCSSIKKVALPDSVTKIGNRVFYGCTSLSDVSLSKNLEIISAYAFYGCSKLVSVIFVTGNKVISEHAFENCYNLGAAALPSTMAEVQSYAFDGCDGLRKVEVPNINMLFGEDNAFPNRSNLYMIGFSPSTAETYTIMTASNITFLSYDGTDKNYFLCTVQIVKNVGNSTIEVWLKDDKEKKANAQNGGKGVEAGTELVVAVAYGNSTVRLVEGSLRCNGTVISKNADGDYVLAMPKGGALITAEFESKNEDTTINGRADDVIVKLSNGEERSDNKDGVKLKVGQSTRLFLIDTSDGNSVIPSSKITFKSDDAATASVSASGMIKALKGGEVKITATVKGNDGKDIVKNVYIIITQADVTSLKLKLSCDNSFAVIDTTKEIQVLSIDQAALKGKALTFNATATAYTEDQDNVAVALKWSSSDITVAKPAKASTADTESSNTFTIPGSAGGEATVTVTATNADKSVVVGKFIVSVQDYTPILTSSSLTFNPNQVHGTVLELIGAYGRGITKTVANTAKFVDSKGKEIEELDLVYDETSTESVARFYIEKGYGLKDGTKTVYLSVLNNGYAIEGLLKKPIKITVKSSYPNPKVAFDKKQEKINLFYKNSSVEIKPVITNLGNAEISKYSLVPLSDNSDDDKLFIQNFKVDEQTGIITQQSEGIKYTSKNKPAVTGYLRLTFKDYKNGNEDYTKDYKITIPTQTVKPSYQLEKTSGTYKTGTPSTVTLKLIDKKTKEQIVLDNSYTITNLNGSVISGKEFTVTENGEIQFPIIENQAAGKAKFAIHKADWAKNSEFVYTYTIKTTNKAPKISLKKSTVTLNKNYPDQPAEFVLTSNQADTKLASMQTFEVPENISDAKRAEYAKLLISYNDGGEVKILQSGSSDIAKGTYKFTCGVRGNDETFNRVTLSVKVVDSKPTVSTKGSLSLNRNAMASEVAALALTYKNLPGEYELNEQATKESIKCTTKDAAGSEKDFTWGFEDHKLVVSLRPQQTKVPSKTYSFTMTPVFTGDEGRVSAQAKQVKFKVKVYEKAISVKLSTKGKLNLLDRVPEGSDMEAYTQKNSIICTPAIANLKDTIQDAQIYDVVYDAIDYTSEQSKYFDIRINEVDGKLYVVPKVGAEIESGKNYKLKVWVKLKNYTFNDPNMGGGTWCTKDLTVKTAQTLPKLTTDKTAISLYASNKDYEATFKVSPKAGSVGKIKEIVFDEKDEKSLDSFDLICDKKEDGSLDVTMKLKAAAYPCNTANKIKMYVIFEGQGTNTKGTAITMNVTIISKN
ncbi:MAG: leucine-rich repeat protein [Lachnospiraceae bacterium]|nr:leucine-rich repeat protein [Lachnospiraceae bacterium]